MSPIEKPIFDMKVNVTLSAGNSTKQPEKTAVKPETNNVNKATKV